MSFTHLRYHYRKEYDRYKMADQNGEQHLYIYNWILCPICKNKTRIRIRNDTEIRNLPLYCPKCHQETLISVKENRLEIITEPDA